MYDKNKPLQEDYPQFLRESDTKPPTGTVCDMLLTGLHPNHAGELFATTGPRSDSTEGGSIISDGGMSRSLSVTKTKRQGRIFDAHETSLDAIGAQYDKGFSENWDDSTTLAARIRAGMVETDGGTDAFLPSDEIEELITFANVRRELARNGVSEAVNKVAKDVSDIVSTPRGTTSRQRIFAILCLQDKASEITGFMKEGVFDDDLPFIISKTVQGDVRRRLGCGAEKQIELFRNKARWKAHELEYFSTSQGKFLAPNFEFSIGDNQKVLHYPLKNEVVLPFVQDILSDGGAGGAIGLAMHREGGFSVVRKVKIHPAHHNVRVKENSQENVFFAIKELKVKKGTSAAHEKEVNNEVLSLKRFNDKRHEHLIRLLATYTHDHRFHLVFPWADGNLMDFWKKPKLDRCSAEETVWMSKQIWGLSLALQSIHLCEINPINPQELPDEAYRKLHGRHGDLKPENILWFKSMRGIQEEQWVDILQIADFGFADFHGPDSKSNVRISRVPGFTDSYKAPEAEGRKHVSPQYDIWSLGCILSQFAIWWMWGWKGVDDFSKRRAEEISDPIMQIKADIFYKIHHGRKRTISLKKTVANGFDQIKKNPACSDYILDLVEVIEWNLLRVKLDLRATVDIVAEKFHQMYQRCRSDANYCVKKTKDPMGSPHRLDDIMEVQRSPKPSVDITEGLSGDGEGRSTTPRGHRGRGKVPVTPVISIGEAKPTEKGGFALESPPQPSNVTDVIRSTAPCSIANYMTITTTPTGPLVSVASEPASTIAIETSTVASFPGSSTKHMPEPAVDEAIADEEKPREHAAAPNKTAQLDTGPAPAETPKQLPHLARVLEVKNNTDLRDSEHEVQNTVSEPKIPNDKTMAVQGKVLPKNTARSKRGRFKHWVQQVLDLFLPEKEPNAPKRRSTQRRSIFRI